MVNKSKIKFLKTCSTPYLVPVPEKALKMTPFQKIVNISGTIAPTKKIKSN